MLPMKAPNWQKELKAPACTSVMPEYWYHITMKCIDLHATIPNNPWPTITAKLRTFNSFIISLKASLTLSFVRVAFVLARGSAGILPNAASTPDNNILAPPTKANAIRQP